jgi:hypothetical protein
MTTLRFKPRIWPRDARDFLLSLTVGLGLPTILFGLVFMVTGRLSAAGGSALVVMAAFLLVSVRRLDVGSDGIRFVRVIGRPRYLPWRDVISVDPVGRREVIVRGWLWPPFPPREATPSLTSLGHFRIRTPRGDTYFPPGTPEQFVNAVREYGRDAT